MGLGKMTKDWLLVKREIVGADARHAAHAAHTVIARLLIKHG